jgi:hypothetical protein
MERAYVIMSKRSDGTPPAWRKAIGKTPDSADVYWFREDAERDCKIMNEKLQGSFYGVFPINIDVLPEDYREDDIA